MDTLGEQLKKEREKKGITLEDAARVTKIRKTYLQALEEGDFSAQSPVFMKGFLKSYAEFLGLESADIITSYEKGIKAVEELREEIEMPVSQKKGTKFLSLFIIVLSLSVVIIAVSIIAFKRWKTVPMAPVPAAEEKKEGIADLKTPGQPSLPTAQEKLFNNLTSPVPVPPGVGGPEGSTATTQPPVAAKPEEETEKPASQSSLPTVQEKMIDNLTPPAPGSSPPTMPQFPATEAPAVKSEEISDKAPEKKIENNKAHVLSMTSRGTVWLRMTVDNGAPTEVVLKKGEVIELFAESKFAIVTGNAGEIDFSLDGKSMGTFGESGKIVSRVFPEAVME